MRRGFSFGERALVGDFVVVIEMGFYEVVWWCFFKVDDIPFAML